MGTIIDVGVLARSRLQSRSSALSNSRLPSRQDRWKESPAMLYSDALVDVGDNWIVF